MPVRLVTSDGVSGSFESMVSVPVAALSRDGVNVTSTVQLLPAASVVVARLHGALPPDTTAKSALPVVAMFETTRSVKPAFVIVKVCEDAIAMV